MLCSEEHADHLCDLDEDVSYSSLTELEKLENTVQSDQCFIRYVVFFITLLISVRAVLECYAHLCSSAPAVLLGTGLRAVMSYIWEGNCRPGGK